MKAKTTKVKKPMINTTTGNLQVIEGRGHINSDDIKQSFELLTKEEDEEIKSYWRCRVVEMMHRGSAILFYNPEKKLFCIGNGVGEYYSPLGTRINGTGYKNWMAYQLNGGIDAMLLKEKLGDFR